MAYAEGQARWDETPPAHYRRPRPLYRWLVYKRPFGRESIWAESAEAAHEKALAMGLRVRRVEPPPPQRR